MTKHPTKPERLVVTIDGPAGVGKSTVASMLARRLDAAFLDTGAMYRALTFVAMKKDIPLDNAGRLLELLGDTSFVFTASGSTMHVFADGLDISSQIRDQSVTANVRFVAACPQVRWKLVQMQQDFASAHPRIVTEGRDQGTVAFPHADVKFFLTAQPEERALRRRKQLAQTGEPADLQTIASQIIRRDLCDTTRTDSPLTPAKDAVTIDTTNLSAAQVVDEMLRHIY